MRSWPPCRSARREAAQPPAAKVVRLQDLEVQGAGVVRRRRRPRLARRRDLPGAALAARRGPGRRSRGRVPKRWVDLLRARLRKTERPAAPKAAKSLRPRRRASASRGRAARPRGLASPLAWRSSAKRRRRASVPLSPRRLAKRAVALAALAAAAALGAKHGLRAAARLPVFDVAELDVSGLRYVSADEVRALAGVAGLDDDAPSVWRPKEEWRRKIESHPMIETVEVARRLPSGLAVRVSEAKPVALVAFPLVMAVDRHGNVLPIDPTDPVLDLPVVAVRSPDSDDGLGLALLAREIDHVAQVAPEVFAVVSEAHLDDRLVTLHVGDSGLRIRFFPPISERRLREGIVALNDALERFPDRDLAEVDLRFEAQVVVRMADALPPAAIASAGPRSPGGALSPGAAP